MNHVYRVICSKSYSFEYFISSQRTWRFDCWKRDMQHKASLIFFPNKFIETSENDWEIDKGGKWTKTDKKATRSLKHLISIQQMQKRNFLCHHKSESKAERQMEKFLKLQNLVHFGQFKEYAIRPTCSQSIELLSPGKGPYAIDHCFLWFFNLFELKKLKKKLLEELSKSAFHPYLF